MNALERSKEKVLMVYNEEVFVWLRTNASRRYTVYYSKGLSTIIFDEPEDAIMFRLRFAI